MNPLIAKARRGETVTLADKIRHESDPAVLRAMRDALKSRGELTETAAQAFATRLVEVERGRG